ncbi:helix-turn-helix domain-containing protein [Rhizobium lentis]|uniref:Helix-turn-helix domain-containing protein n=1 Tax=Rhizobium lentis TaxID=1138194 RepID=A0ABS7ICR3_9HYPH|nr:helix-turn-helix domain-containing protein [Rhizobium lentis]MBX5088326.1 helix-turn-helix domain-containing protein [Rhizobium lentis]
MTETAGKGPVEGAASSDATTSEPYEKLQAPRHSPLGSVIRRLRKEKGLSLKQLSESSGVSVGMLSQVERDVSNPSVRVLSAIRQALDAPLSVLFEPSVTRAEDPDFVRRAKSRPVLELGHLNKELLSSKSSHNLQLMILHVDKGGSSGEQPLSYPAEKGGMVLRGEIILQVGSQEAHLYAGDSFVFGPSVPHAFRHAGGEPSEVFWIIGPVSLDKQV